MSAQVAADLRAAADVLERDGWAQGGLQPNGRCVMEAVISVAGPASDAVSGAANAIRMHIRWPLGLPLVEWNDDPSRSADEVIATLRAAADEAEATA